MSFLVVLASTSVTTRLPKQGSHWRRPTHPSRTPRKLPSSQIRGIEAIAGGGKENREARAAAAKALAWPSRAAAPLESVIDAVLE